MPPVAAIDRLPDHILNAINDKLIDNGFGDYVGLANWLKDQGYMISKSAVARYGKDRKALMEEQMTHAMQHARDRMEIAKALRGASDDEKAALMEANEMVAMDQLMNMFEEVDGLEVAERMAAVPRLVRAIADLNRSAIGSAKWKKEFEVEARRQARKEAAELAGDIVKKQGLSDTDWAVIRAKFLGVEVEKV